ncbi:hypothetical protein ACV229_36760 [Burkholderia sp. MR1-5-21]
MMFGLYPAGPQWIKFYQSKANARALQQSLVDCREFVAGIFHQPFGAQRGFVVAQRDHFLVLADSMDTSEPEVVVVPDVELQNFLWSFNTGYAGQWSARELRALTGHGDWDSLIRASVSAFASIADDVQKAADGQLVKPVAAPTLMTDGWPDDDDSPWLPADCMHDAPYQEVLPCAR